MCFQIDKTQAHLVLSVFDQSLHELNDSFLVHGNVIQHEPELALVFDRGHNADLLL